MHCRSKLLTSHLVLVPIPLTVMALLMLAFYWQRRQLQGATASRSSQYIATTIKIAQSLGSHRSGEVSQSGSYLARWIPFHLFILYQSRRNNIKKFGPFAI